MRTTILALSVLCTAFLGSSTVYAEEREVKETDQPAKPYNTLPANPDRAGKAAPGSPTVRPSGSAKPVLPSAPKQPINHPTPAGIPGSVGTVGKTAGKTLSLVINGKTYYEPDAELSKQLFGTLPPVEFVRPAKNETLKGDRIISISVRTHVKNATGVIGKFESAFMGADMPATLSEGVGPQYAVYGYLAKTIETINLPSQYEPATVKATVRAVTQYQGQAYYSKPVERSFKWYSEGIAEDHMIRVEDNAISVNPFPPYHVGQTIIVSIGFTLGYGGSYFPADPIFEVRCMPTAPALKEGCPIPDMTQVVFGQAKKVGTVAPRDIYQIDLKTKSLNDKGEYRLTFSGSIGYTQGEGSFVLKPSEITIKVE